MELLEQNFIVFVYVYDFIEFCLKICPVPQEHMERQPDMTKSIVILHRSVYFKVVGISIYTNIRTTTMYPFPPKVDHGINTTPTLYHVHVKLFMLSLTNILNTFHMTHLSRSTQSHLFFCQLFYRTLHRKLVLCSMETCHLVKLSTETFAELFHQKLVFGKLFYGKTCLFINCIVPALARSRSLY